MLHVFVHVKNSRKCLIQASVLMLERCGGKKFSDAATSPRAVCLKHSDAYNLQFKVLLEFGTCTYIKIHACLNSYNSLEECALGSPNVRGHPILSDRCCSDKSKRGNLTVKSKNEAEREA